MFVQQCLDLFVMSTMELSAAPQSVQVLTCVLVPNLFIFLGIRLRLSYVKVLTLFRKGLNFRSSVDIFDRPSSFYYIFHYAEIKLSDTNL